MYQPTVQLQTAGSFKVDVRKISELISKKKAKVVIHRHWAKNPLTNNGILLSSVNKLLVVADENWNVQQVIH